MKVCARLGRPAPMKAVSDIRLTTAWSKADDIRCTVSCHTQTCIVHGVLLVKEEGLWPSSLVDAASLDRCRSSPIPRKWTPRVAVGEPNSFEPWSWVSPKQTATARSTTEAEIILLGSVVILRKSMQEFPEQIFVTRKKMEAFWPKLYGLVSDQFSSESKFNVAKCWNCCISSKRTHKDRFIKPSFAGCKAEIFSKACGIHRCIR